MKFLKRPRDSTVSKELQQLQFGLPQVFSKERLKELTRGYAQEVAKGMKAGVSYIFENPLFSGASTMAGNVIDQLDNVIYISGGFGPASLREAKLVRAKANGQELSGDKSTYTFESLTTLAKDAYVIADLADPLFKNPEKAEHFMKQIGNQQFILIKDFSNSDKTDEFIEKYQTGREIQKYAVPRLSTEVLTDLIARGLGKYELTPESMVYARDFTGNNVPAVQVAVGAILNHAKEHPELLKGWSKNKIEIALESPQAMYEWTKYLSSKNSFHFYAEHLLSNLTDNELKFLAGSLDTNMQMHTQDEVSRDYLGLMQRLDDAKLINFDYSPRTRHVVGVSEINGLLLKHYFKELSGKGELTNK